MSSSLAFKYLSIFIVSTITWVGVTAGAIYFIYEISIYPEKIRAIVGTVCFSIMSIILFFILVSSYRTYRMYNNMRKYERSIKNEIEGETQRYVVNLPNTQVIASSPNQKQYSDDYYY